MPLRDFGQTGLRVPPLGLGAGPLGDERLDDAQAIRLVHAAIDLGVTFIDTAPSYGASEERLGRALAGRRDRVVLSTKVGYGAAGLADWTYACVRRNIDDALVRLRASWIDVVHLHSCPREVLARGEVIDALNDAVRAGQVLAAAYSGDGDALAHAIGTQRFASVQCSLSVADQRALGSHVPVARAARLGVVAKRPLANCAWRHATRPAAPDVATYWDRLRAMALPDDGLDPAERSLRFVLAQPGVHVAIVGTTSESHLRAACAWADRGPLPAEQVEAIRAAFRKADRGPAWDGIV